MRLLPCLPLLLCAACAAHVAPNTSASARAQPADAVTAPVASPSATTPGASSPAEASSLAQAAVDSAAQEQAALVEDGAEGADGEADDDSGAAVDGFDSTEGDEAESSTVPAGTPEVQYTADLPDEELQRLWKENPAALGSVSVGFVHSGRMVNSVRFPSGEDWIVVSPDKAWTTTETVDYLTQVIRELRTRYPQAPLLRVNQLSAKDGGYLRPHKSHQNGRDVDLGFYYPGGNAVRARAREKYIDPAMNWALVRALVTLTDVQVILVDRRVQKVLYDHALKSGEDKAWLDSLFHAGEGSIIKHARGHRDHFHVRFFNPRAQELGRRIAPLLALQPEHNIAMHRVRKGDTLGAIAMRYNSTVNALRNANRIRGTLLRIGQVLSVPLRGPCTQCPVPPPVVVPPRRLPAVAKVDAPAEVKASVQARADVQPAVQPQAEAPATVPANAVAPAAAQVPGDTQPAVHVVPVTPPSVPEETQAPAALPVQQAPQPTVVNTPGA
ncbi:LysM peptidoglycan-binding domain-containing protein [Hyalangium gracile]|uniref:LysM peptidoglycan-binding domain-containing protein n=1 Tax=Hyalangium gracile TaxID=394092 RepID=UPI001CCAFDD8|nr:penicillin-insensitive murein endopeptidase [Hyalangium gracile]